MRNKRIIRGREISADDIAIIRTVIKVHFPKCRKYSRMLCHHWKWYQPNGHTKDMSCRYLLLSSEREGLIQLPPHLNSAHNEKKKVEEITLDILPLTGMIKDHPSL
ncbi:MAG: hypothetical protein MRK01_11735 [Candidatus Scalindua sp.]|nr:hypothetical protein [Candidatus Scalindua sp.]